MTLQKCKKLGLVLFKRRESYEKHPWLKQAHRPSAYPRYSLLASQAQTFWLEPAWNTEQRGKLHKNRTGKVTRHRKFKLSLGFGQKISK